MADVGFIAVDKTSTIDARKNIGRLSLDCTNWTRDQIILALRGIAVTEVDNQIKLGNPPTAIRTDGQAGKDVQSANRRVEVFFGQNVTLKPAALSMVHKELMSAIKKTTGVKTGRLSNPANWDWTYVKEGRNMAIPMGASGIPMGPDTFLVLKPSGVPHATIVNMWVAKGAGKAVLRAKTKRGAPAKSGRSIGFLRAAANKASRNGLLEGFKAVVRFSRRFKQQGEISKVQGTGCIVVMAQGLKKKRR